MLPQAARLSLPLLVITSAAPPLSVWCLQALLRGSLRKAFNGFDLLCLGLGIVIGTGTVHCSAMRTAAPCLLFALPPCPSPTPHCAVVALS